jgi:hypothetical protein
MLDDPYSLQYAKFRGLRKEYLRKEFGVFFMVIKVESQHMLFLRNSRKRLWIFSGGNTLISIFLICQIIC